MICSRVKDTRIIIHPWIGIGIGLRVGQSPRVREIWDMGMKKVITEDVVKSISREIFDNQRREDV